MKWVVARKGRREIGPKLPTLWAETTPVGGTYNWEGPASYPYAGNSIFEGTAPQAKFRQLDGMLECGGLRNPAHGQQIFQSIQYIRFIINNENSFSIQKIQSFHDSVSLKYHRHQLPSRDWHGIA
jgi:hypothetical protein